MMKAYRSVHGVDKLSWGDARIDFNLHIIRPDGEAYSRGRTVGLEASNKTGAALVGVGANSANKCNV